MKRLALVAAVVLVSCATIQPNPGGGFSISPATASADPGQAIKFVLDIATGAPPIVTWTVVGGGSIAADGTLTTPGCTATLPATVTVTATSGTFSATAVATVDDRVTSVSINPPTVSLAPGATQKFTATVKTVCVPAGVTTAMKATRPANGGPPVIAVLAK